MKKCSNCKKVKQLFEFSKNRTKHDGLRDSCKACDSVANKRYRKLHPEEVKEYHLKWQRENPNKHWQYTKKWRAKSI